MHDSNDSRDTPALQKYVVFHSLSVFCTVQVTERSRCALGLDIGAYNSKLTLGLINPRDGRAIIHRVPALRKSNPTSAGNFEFPASASLEKDGTLSIGMDAVKSDITIPIKTIFMYMAGIRRKSIYKKLPGCIWPILL